jgi:hypothetical protein
VPATTDIVSAFANGPSTALELVHSLPAQQLDVVAASLSAGIKICTALTGGGMRTSTLVVLVHWSSAQQSDFGVASFSTMEATDVCSARRVTATPVSDMFAQFSSAQQLAFFLNSLRILRTSTS